MALGKGKEAFRRCTSFLIRDYLHVSEFCKSNRLNVLNIQSSSLMTVDFWTDPSYTVSSWSISRAIPSCYSMSLIMSQYEVVTIVQCRSISHVTSSLMLIPRLKIGIKHDKHANFDFHHGPLHPRLMILVSQDGRLWFEARL